MDPRPRFFLANIGLQQFDPPLKVRNQHFHFESALVGVSLETG
jgi:hypothetical protein